MPCSICRTWRRCFGPAAPHITDDPQAIILQAQIKRLKAEKDAAADKAGAAKPGAENAGAKKPQAAHPEPDDKTPDPAAESDQAEGTAPISRHLPPIYELIEQGKVLALNMPAGINPALARAVGVMLKNAWPTGASHATGQDEG